MSTSSPSASTLDVGALLCIAHAPCSSNPKPHYDPVQNMSPPTPAEIFSEVHTHATRGTLKWWDPTRIDDSNLNPIVIRYRDNAPLNVEGMGNIVEKMCRNADVVIEPKSVSDISQDKVDRLVRSQTEAWRYWTKWNTSPSKATAKEPPRGLMCAIIIHNPHILNMVGTKPFRDLLTRSEGAHIKVVICADTTMIVPKWLQDISVYMVKSRGNRTGTDKISRVISALYQHDAWAVRIPWARAMSRVRYYSEKTKDDIVVQYAAPKDAASSPSSPPPSASSSRKRKSSMNTQDDNDDDNDDTEPARKTSKPGTDEEDNTTDAFHITTSHRIPVPTGGSSTLRTHDMFISSGKAPMVQYMGTSNHFRDALECGVHVVHTMQSCRPFEIHLGFTHIIPSVENVRGTYDIHFPTGFPLALLDTSLDVIKIVQTDPRFGCALYGERLSPSDFAKLKNMKDQALCVPLYRNYLCFLRGLVDLKYVIDSRAQFPKKHCMGF